MEPKRREDRTAPDRKPSEPSASSAAQVALTAPFASEGLERLRDSHC